MKWQLLTLVRALVVALLVFTTAAVAVETMHVPGVAVAKNGKGGGSGNGHGNGNGNDHGKGHKDDKATKQAKKKKDKENRGQGKDEPIVIVQAPNTTPVAVTPAPTATAAPAAAHGTLLLHVGRCGATPVANAEWTSACATPVLGARFDLSALDGPLSGWMHELSTDANGTATLDGMPPGRYELTRIAGGWCHAESDRVDAEGKLVVTAGQTTTVWIAVCG